MNHLHTIEHFRRLTPEVRHALAVQFDLVRSDDDGDQAHQWLLRARDGGKLDALGLAVQLAPQ